MAPKTNPKREKQIESARRIAEATGDAYLDPQILFGRASNDDMDRYTPEMLALSAVHTAKELSEWTGNAPRISIDQIEDVTPDGVSISVLSITDRNMPFLYESIMGEVTSSYRDVFMALHPILIISEGSATRLYSSDAPPKDAAQLISHIQLHLAALTPAQADDLSKRIATVLEQTHLTISDWKPMLGRLDTVIEELSAHDAGRRKADRDEALAFLSWLRDGNFTFLGMRDDV
jgi:glutamate dehydrogenase